MDTPETNPPAEAESLALAVPHPEFKAGLPAGRYHVIVNPKKAHRFMAHRLFANGISIPMIGLGIAVVLWGYVWPGICLGAAGILLRRIIKEQAPKMLLTLVQNDPKAYYDAIEFEIIEVRAARDDVSAPGESSGAAPPAA